MCERRPRGLGIRTQMLHKPSMMLLIADSLTSDDKVRIACGLYALYRTTNGLRRSTGLVNGDSLRLLRLWSKNGAAGSKAMSLLV